MKTSSLPSFLGTLIALIFDHAASDVPGTCLSTAPFLRGTLSALTLLGHVATDVTAIISSSPINLWILIALTFIGHAASTDPEISISPHENIFEAISCEAPQGLRNLHYPRGIAEGLCSPKTEVISLENRTFHVYQVEEFQRRKAYSCSLVETKSVAQCTSTGHASPDSRYSYDDLPIAVSLEDCKKAYHTGKYTVPTPWAKAEVATYEVRMNQLSFHQFYERGYNTLWSTTGGMRCHGDGWTTPDGDPYAGANINIQNKFILREELILSNENEVRSQYDNVLVPCQHTSDGCVSATKTWVWDSEPAEFCTLAFVRNVSGVDVIDKLGNNVFISRDDSLTRFVKKSPVSMCGRVVFPTNNEKLFLLEETINNPLITRRKSTSEISPSTFMAVRDFYLFEHSLELVESQFHQILKEDCLQKNREKKLEHFLQHSDARLVNYIWENHVHGLSSGEIIYVFSCVPVLVRIIPSAVCYHSAPVERISPPGNDTVDIYRGKTLFMEPLTRRLTTHGILSACSQTFPAKWMNVHKHWLFIHPVIRAAPSPEMVETFNISTVNWEGKVDSSRSGLYTEKDMIELEQQQTIGFYTDSINVAISRQTTPLRFEQEYLLPENVFPRMPDPERWATQLYKSMIDFLHAWGQAASIFVSIIIIWKFVTTVLKWVYNLVVLRDVHGCASELLWIPCAGMMLMRNYRRQERRRRRPPSTGHEEEEEDRLFNHNPQAPTMQQHHRPEFKETGKKQPDRKITVQHDRNLTPAQAQKAADYFLSLHPNNAQNRLSRSYSRQASPTPSVARSHSADNATTPQPFGGYPFIQRHAHSTTFGLFNNGK